MNIMLHQNIDSECLTSKGLHLNNNGVSLFASNLNFYIRSQNEVAESGGTSDTNSYDRSHLNLSLSKIRGFKMALLNIISLPKYIDHLRILLNDQLLESCGEAVIFQWTAIFRGENRVTKGRFRKVRLRYGTLEYKQLQCLLKVTVWRKIFVTHTLPYQRRKFFRGKKFMFREYSNAPNKR